jgi:hypothetical protein
MQAQADLKIYALIGYWRGSKILIRGSTIDTKRAKALAMELDEAGNPEAAVDVINDFAAQLVRGSNVPVCGTEYCEPIAESAERPLPGPEGTPSRLSNRLRISGALPSRDGAPSGPGSGT